MLFSRVKGPVAIALTAASLGVSGCAAPGHRSQSKDLGPLRSVPTGSPSSGPFASLSSPYTRADVSYWTTKLSLKQGPDIRAELDALIQKNDVTQMRVALHVIDTQKSTETYVRSLTHVLNRSESSTDPVPQFLGPVLDAVEKERTPRFVKDIHTAEELGGKRLLLTFAHYCPERTAKLAHHIATTNKDPVLSFIARNEVARPEGEGRPRIANEMIRVAIERMRPQTLPDSIVTDPL